MTRKPKVATCCSAGHTWSTKSSGFPLQLYYDHVGTGWQGAARGPRHPSTWNSSTASSGMACTTTWCGDFDYRFTHDNTDNTPDLRTAPLITQRQPVRHLHTGRDQPAGQPACSPSAPSWSTTTYSGIEYQPNARLAWSLDNSQTLWGAVSRAVRTPARGEHDVMLRLVPPPAADPGIPVYAEGDDGYDPEESDRLRTRLPPEPQQHLVNRCSRVLQRLRQAAHARPVRGTRTSRNHPPAVRQQHERRNLRTGARLAVAGPSRLAPECQLLLAGHATAPRRQQ